MLSKFWLLAMLAIATPLLLASDQAGGQSVMPLPLWNCSDNNTGRPIVGCPDLSQWPTAPVLPAPMKPRPAITSPKTPGSRATPV